MNRVINPMVEDRLVARGELGGHAGTFNVPGEKAPLDGAAARHTGVHDSSRGRSAGCRRRRYSGFVGSSAPDCSLTYLKISEKDRSLRRRKEPELPYLLKTPERYMDRSKSSL